MKKNKNIIKKKRKKPREGKRWTQKNETKKPKKKDEEAVERVMHINEKREGERRKLYGFCKGGEEMEVHIQSYSQRVKSASHQSLLGDSQSAAALGNARGSKL